MPQDGSMSALIVSKVSQVARGLSNISTKIDPNWAGGELLIAVHNFSRDIITLDYSEPICTVIFFENKTSSKKAPRSGGIDRFSIASSQEAKIKRWILNIIPIIIVLAVPAIAYLIYGEGVIFTASVTIGVALSQIVAKITG
jgi:hypothetical protein